MLLDERPAVDAHDTAATECAFDDAFGLLVVVFLSVSGHEHLCVCDQKIGIDGGHGNAQLILHRFGLWQQNGTIGVAVGIAVLANLIAQIIIYHQHYVVGAKARHRVDVRIGVVAR